MVKDWGMSEKIGLRTMVENPKSFHGETLGPTTNEMVSVLIRFCVKLNNGSLISRWTVKFDEFCQRVTIVLNTY